MFLLLDIRTGIVVDALGCLSLAELRASELDERCRESRYKVVKGWA